MKVGPMTNRPIPFWEGCGGERGRHTSRRHVKCLDHAVKIVCKHRGPSRVSKSRLTKRWNEIHQYIVKCIRTVTTQTVVKAQQFCQIP